MKKLQSNENTEFDKIKIPKGKHESNALRVPNKNEISFSKAEIRHTEDFSEEFYQMLVDSKWGEYQIKNVRVGCVIVRLEDHRAELMLVTELSDDYIVKAHYAFTEDLGKSVKSFKLNNSRGVRESRTSYREFMQFYKNLTIYPSIKDYLEFYNRTDEDTMSPEDLDINDGIDSSSALVYTKSTSAILAKQAEMQQKIELANKHMSAVLYKLEEKKMKLAHYKRKLDKKIALMRKEVKRITDVIWTIELYLGVKETIHQIYAGDAASPEQTLDIFQMSSYMDEEVGNPWEQGLDYTNISDFDDWLGMVGPDGLHNYERILTKRCIMMFRVRRSDKHYSNNPWVNDMVNMNNKKTYMIIRNGDNLYRINIDATINKFFPDQDEFQKIMEEEEWHGIEKDEEQKESNLKDAYVKYQRHMLIIQGLIDRTEIFNPMPKVKLEKSTVDGTIIFHYTNRINLPSERETFGAWLTRINSHVDKGSRIIWPDCRRVSFEGHHAQRKHSLGAEERFSERFWTYREKNYNLPKSPKPGIYWIQKTVKDKNGKIEEYELLIPKIFDWYMGDQEERKNKRTLYRIYPSDNFINYDMVTIEDIDYYLYDRSGRIHYITMMPLLMEIRKWLVADLEEEKDFVKMMISVLYSDGYTATTEEITALIKWWKTKNIWKRSITHDDEKAIRMINKEYKRRKLNNIDIC